MKKLILLILSMLFYGSVIAQFNKYAKESPGKYMKGFQEFTVKNPNADSAYYCIQKLNSREEYYRFFEMTMYSDLAQGLILKDLSKLDSMKVIETTKKQVLYQQILGKIIADTSKILVEMTKPMFFLSKIQNSQNNVLESKKLTQEFINTQLLPNLIYTNKTGTFGLLIYRTISKQIALKPLAEQLFAKISSHLKNNQIVITDSIKRADLSKRAWHRYMYAYLNFVKANEIKDKVKKKELLKIASHYSPDHIDQVNDSYVYDSYLLFGVEKKGFKDDYLDFIETNNTDKTKILATLLSMSLLEPANKDRLKTYYRKYDSTGKSFDDYWLEAVNNNGKIAPVVLLSELDTKLFSSKEFSGKWILLDFWGTWCAGCIAEHPNLQKLYDIFEHSPNKNIALLTVACQDTPEKVLAYMQKKKYSFPVAMSDSKIEKNFAVDGYPTKVLINPKGKYITIPGGTDWVNFVKQYTNL
jgi:thiol-disulfide isomerase/thioredoxin